MPEITITLANFSSNVKKCGYTVEKVYYVQDHIKYVLLYTSLQRKPFIVEVSNITSPYPENVLEPAENDYHNFAQRDCLGKINLPRLACFSTHNCCIKTEGEYICYLFDAVSESASLSDEPEDSDSDIEIDDYPIEDIYPVYMTSSFLDEDSKPVEKFEEIVLADYSVIVDDEETMNEKDIAQLLKQFDDQKSAIKEKMYIIHRNAYNTRRDIAQQGLNLQKAYILRDRSVNESDRIRFRIERLVSETEEKIDRLNKNLREQRSQADCLLKKYWRYIKKF